jgi:hypothetical protein
MTLEDGWLLTKKIAIGIVITVVPLAILAEGLWLTRQLHSHALEKPSSPTKAASHAN